MTTDQLITTNNVSWQPVQKPADAAESRLVEAILDGTFPVNSHLPAERELAELVGVTRPTLREALQRLARDGWVEIHQGKPTRVRDYWQEGSLGVLSALAEHPSHLPEDFIPNLLSVRLVMAPAYTASAVSKYPQKVVALLECRHNLDGDPDQFAQFDWVLQHKLTLMSENPVFVMILNGFEELFRKLAPFYFANQAARQHSLAYYNALADAAATQDPDRAKILTEAIMRDSLEFWQQTQFA